jgi:tRNA threonylcarbamoyl adenosine modification protein (Sua5/YciO/YrdC/YwlC family)
MSVVDEAIIALRMGKLVVIPTDTVYGVAARPEMPDAVASLFGAKGRPEDKAIPVLGASLVDLEKVVVFNDAARKLAARYWPGPVTVILPRADGFAADLGGSRKETIAVRVPKEPRAIELLRRTGPLAVTSANPSGATEATTVAEARAALGSSVAVYIDGGRCSALPSTIVFLAGERRVLRAGAIPAEEIFRTMQ